MPTVTIKSPIPGTFYRRPAPGEAPFLSEGGEVSAGDVVGVVEIMKSFHEVRSEQSGILDRFLVDDDDVVEAGQDIAVLR